MTYIPGGVPTNLSTSAITASGSTTPRSLAARTVDQLNARDWGAKGDGVTDDGAALTACGVAAASTGKDVYIPAGRYSITSPSQWVIQPGVAYYLNKHATMLCNSAANSTSPCTNNGVAGDYTIIGGCFHGKADTTPTASGNANLIIYNAGTVLYDNVRTEYSLSFGMAIVSCHKGTIRNCSAYRNLGDSLSVWSTPDALITNNDVEGAVDDAISAHTFDTDTMPRSVVVITNNRIKFSQGIRVLGAKMVTIANNVLRSVFSIGIEVGGETSFAQGDTPNFGVKIVNNQIFDQMCWPGPTPRNGGNNAILVFAPKRSIGNGTFIPGDPIVSSGSGSSLIGAANSSGTLYTQTATGPRPGCWWFDISGNTIARTKPSVASVSEWGEESLIWMGNNASGSTYSAAITNANLQPRAILLAGTIRDSRIADNIIRVGSDAGIYFSDNPMSGDYDGLEICGNHISNVTAAAIYSAATALSSHQMRIHHNTINGDPEFTSNTRSTGGTWTTNTAPVGIYMPLIEGVVYESNHFRNVAKTVVFGSSRALFLNNVFFGNCATFNGFSTTNAGIGSPPVVGPGWKYVQEDSDPRSSTYGQVMLIPATPVITGSRAGESAASSSTRAALVALGLVIDNTSP